jgi:hypothetical protein
MGSKYDSYWQVRLGDLSRLVADAAAGKVASLVVDDIVNNGDRRSWHGNARIRGRMVVISHMAHLDSLARITTGAGLFDPWPDTEFSLSMNDARILTVRAATDRQDPDGTATHARAQPGHTALAVVADTSPAPEPAIACAEMHALLASLALYERPKDVPFDNGLYFFYEAGESSAHAPDGRIVRIGNHPRAQDRLIGRLKDHYRTRPNAKNGSVFRRYIGGALLRRDNPQSSCLMPAPGKGHWELQNAHECPTCAPYEERVTEHMKQTMRFRCLRIDDLEERNAFEALLIATVAACPICTPSPEWLGQHCYSPAVRATGLWNSEFVYGTTVTEGELGRLHTLGRARIADATDDLADMLLVIPCSASKRGTVLSGPLTPRSVADDLDAEARQMLEEGRRLAFTKRGTTLNEASPLRPALEWYTGQPYETAGFRALLLGALERGLESGQLVVTLSAEILAVTHRGFGPAKPGYDPPVSLCDSSSTRRPSGSSSMDTMPCTWALSYGLAESKTTTVARGSRIKLAVLRRFLGSANTMSSPSRLVQTTVECGRPSGSRVERTAKFLPSNSRRTLSLIILLFLS